MTSTQNTGSSQTGALTPSSILSHAAKCLGTDDTTVRNPHEAVALIGHACMTAVGFRLIGLDEDHSIDPAKTSSGVLPKEWNANSTYSFKYAHQQSSMQYLLKISRLGSKAVIFALALGDDRTASFDLPTKDYISESALPLSADSQANISDRLNQIFVSSTRVGDLIGLFKVNVIQKLAPGLQKEGYEDTSRQTQQASRQSGQRDEREPARDPLRDDRMPQPARPYPFNDPLAAPPRNPMPTGDFLPPRFEDEFEINAPPRGYYPGYGERRPLNIGERDLYPPGIAPHDPLRGHFGPQRGGGGMHPTFDDPMFGGMGGGGQEFIPRAPAGARYDPVGPDDNPPSGRGGRPNFRGGFGGPRGGFGGPGGFGGFGGFGGDII